LNSWNEDIRDVVICGEAGSHGFLESEGGEIFEYMNDDSINILEFEADDRYGVAVSVYG
jgi:hypothetical protein